MHKCSNCDHCTDVYLSDYSSLGLYKASCCELEMKLVDSGVARECAQWKGKVIAVTPILGGMSK